MEVKEFFKKAKVGDMVTLRADLKADNQYGTDTYIVDMPKPGTSGLVIRTLCEDSNKFRVKDCVWNFTPEMVERICTDEDGVQKNTTSRYKVGDVVVFRSDLVENKLNSGTCLTFFPEGPVKAGAMATIVEILPDSGEKNDKTAVFRVQDSPYYYDSGMLSEGKEEESDDTTMSDKERTVQTIIDRIGDMEKVFNFLDQKLAVGCVVKIRENAHRTPKYWGCRYLPGCMLESGRTAKISHQNLTIASFGIYGNRFRLDKDKSDYVYSVPMFDAVYCITRNPFIYKEFLETFDVDMVTEEKTECKISAELIRESIKKLQELEKVFEKMLQ